MGSRKGRKGKCNAKAGTTQRHKPLLLPPHGVPEDVVFLPYDRKPDLYNNRLMATMGHTLVGGRFEQEKSHQGVWNNYRPLLRNLLGS
jgi:hypothetical protein